MTIKFSDYPIRGIDISRFNDNEDTDRLPDLSKLTNKGLSFVAVRIGYGLVKDSLFDYYWKYLKELGIILVYCLLIQNYIEIYELDYSYQWLVEIED